MKQMRILCAILVFSLASTSCESYFDVKLDDQPNIEDIFSTTNGTKKYLAHIYSYIPMEEEIVGSEGWVVPRSDEAQYSFFQWVNYLQIKTGSYSSGTVNGTGGDLVTADAAYYNFWRKNYVAINQCSTFLKYVDLNKGESPDKIKAMKAEARFLRALSYYWLVTEWGDVPLVLKVLESTEEVRANNYRRPKAEIYQAIFDDLKYVTESPLPDVQPASACGKVSKAAAWALWGKALLQQACDEDFIGSKSELLGQAIGKLTAAWDLRKFGELSSVSYSSVWDLSTQKSCAENIFQVNYIQGNADLGSVWNYMYGPEGAGVTSQRKGEMQNVTIQAVYDSFEPGDVRRSFLRATNKAGQTYYHTMKYADLECGANGYGGNNWIVLRYADVALMLAEAYYWSKEETLAKTWLNKVRERAGLGDWSGSDLRQGIYDERLHEFMQEGLRWQDLLRMYDRMEMLEHFSAINSNFSLKDLLLPIPYNERILNPEGLYQNPGYGSN